jgi:hypothetical protein
VSQPTRGETTAIERLLAKLPDWAVVVLFLVLAVILALAGQLDDWLRAALTVVFSLLAIAFAARLAQRHDRTEP